MPFQPFDPLVTDFLPADGTLRKQLTYGEPGTPADASVGNTDEPIYACYPQVTQITDIQLAGTSPNTGTFTLVITPVLTPSGSAGSEALGSVTLPIVFSVGTTLANMVLGIITAIGNASTISGPGGISGYSRILSYIKASVSPTGSAYLRLESRNPGETFQVVLTPPAGNTVAYTAVQTPSETPVYCGAYVAIDTTRGTNGFDNNGSPYIKVLGPSTPASQIIGPVMVGVDTAPMESGAITRDYLPGSVVPLYSYGRPLVYGEAAIAAASIGGSVYARHTASGSKLVGFAGDATAAALGATANVWTGTPTAVNDTVYTQQIIFGDEVVLLTFLSDGSATATEIVTGLKDQLALHTGVGGRLYGLTGSGTTTFIITGPSDGRGFTPSSNGAGVLTWVETTAEVSTHTLLTRGDKFHAASYSIGSVPVSIPHP